MPPPAWDLRTYSLPLRLDSSPEEKERRSKAALFRALSLRTTIAFCGAGCSAYHSIPLWPEFVRRLLAETRAVLDRRSASGEALGLLDLDVLTGQISDYAKLLRDDETVDSRSLMHIAGFCKRVLHEVESDNESLATFLAKNFGNPKRIKAPRFAPYDALLGLGVQRFITTNYDNVLERLLEQKNKATLSFTQQAEYTDELAVFPLSNHRAMANTVAIFHCHGHYSQPHSIVASEDDFQRWYLRRNNAQSECLRQCLELSLGSNPILFVGYGFGDDDLLRPLRLLSAMSPGNRITEPLFALLPGSDWARFDYYYSRWRVHVIPYELKTKVDEHSRTLHGKLVELRAEWQEWRDQWAHKPRLRTTHGMADEADQPRTYYHYFPDLDSDDWTDRLPTMKQVYDEAHESVLSDSVRLLFLHGPSGSGKSYAAWRLLEKCAEDRGRFYWSSYYDQDWLNGFKAAADFLCGSLRPNDSDSLLERIGRGLREAPPSVLVFDGFERLLSESSGGRVTPINNTVGEFIRLLQTEPNDVTVIICTSLLPEDLWEAEVVSSPRLDLSDYEKLNCLRGFSSRLPAFCSLLDGHVYGTYLLESLLRELTDRKPKETKERIEELLRRLASVSADRRVQQLISFVVECADDLDRHGAAGGLLERLALFHKPPPAEVARTAYQATRLDQSADSDIVDEDFDELVGLLRELGLLFEVRSDSAAGEKRYMLHEAVRVNVFRDRFLAEDHPLAVFSSPTFASSVPAASHPGSKRAEAILEGLFELVAAHADGTQGDPGDLPRRRLYTQYAYSLVRSCTDANAATRWCRLGKYTSYSLRVAAAAKHCAPGTWDYAPTSAGRTVTHEDAPLSADELAWLYTDIGLALFARGDLRDAQAIFDQATTIRRHVQPFAEEWFHELQSLLQLGHLLIDRGRLAQAHKILHRALKIASRFEHEECMAGARGHLGLIANLRGDYDEARDLFKKCKKALAETSNQRGRSHFLRLQADFYMRLGEDGKAKEALELSLAIANSGDYPDLVHYARNSLGRYYRRKKHFVQARREYEAARSFAAEMEVNKLEAEVLRELARLSLDLGDFENAKRLAKRSLRLANDLGLALQQAHSLFVLGLANTRSPNPELGLIQIRFARDLSRARQYWSLDRLIEETVAAENLRAADRPVTFEPRGPVVARTGPTDR